MTRPAVSAPVSNLPAPMAYRLLLLVAIAAGVLIPVLGLSVAIEAATTIGIGQFDFVFFIGAVAALGGTSVVVGVAILWQKRGNRIGLVMVTGGLLLMSTFTAWPTAILLGDAGDVVASALANLWGTIVLLPAIALLFPAVGILFPDEHLPGSRWRAPIAAGIALLAVGTVLQVIAPWRLGGDVNVPNPVALAALPPELSELGGALAALGTFLLFAISVVAVLVRLRRSEGVEHAQQKWLVASVVLMAVAFPLSFATDVGPDKAIDLLSVFTGALVPIAVGIAVLRYHVFEIDRIVSRTIGYAIVTGALLLTYAAAILVLQATVGTLIGGDAPLVALSTLAVAVLFQPIRRRVQSAVDRRFDRARFDAEQTSHAFADRLRAETDINVVTRDLRVTVEASMHPTGIAVWLR